MTDDEPLYIDWQKMDWWSRAAKRKKELRLKVKYLRRYGRYWKEEKLCEQMTNDDKEDRKCKDTVNIKGGLKND